MTTRAGTAGSPAVVAEQPVPGEVPRYEIPGWRERLGLVAGVTARGSEPGRGFDLGLWTEAPVGEVMTRWRALRRMEPGFRGTVLGHQVHGARVVWHQKGEGWLQLEGVDGHATAAPGLLLTVTVADCIPVYLADPVRRIIALLHSGWRGTAAGILAAGIQRMVGAGSVVGDVVMHCGVGICGECYEVGHEVMDGCGLSASGAGPWHADLRAVLARQAGDLGIGATSTSHWCSMHDYPTFFSHRASGGRDGRMVAFLGILP
ncbi:MAG TPA: polyphenol oxidase family protein [Gemmatimonadales bacterium]|nr:polyphenol oxidase family protein [Gemmatimonadales bacterium]